MVFPWFGASLLIMSSAALPSIDARTLVNLIEDARGMVQSYEAHLDCTQKRQVPPMKELRATLARRNTLLRRSENRLLFQGEASNNPTYYFDQSESGWKAFDDDSAWADRSMWENPEIWKSVNPKPSAFALNAKEVRTLEAGAPVPGGPAWNAALNTPDSVFADKKLNYNADVGLWLTEGRLWNDRQPLLEKAKGAANLRVRPQAELIGGNECYVLEFEAAEGSYTVWVDANRGFSPLRIEGKMSAASPTEYTYVRGSWHFEIADIQLEEVDGVWFPTEGTYRRSFDWPEPGEFWEERVRLSDIKLNEAYSEKDFSFDFPADALIADFSTPMETYLREQADGTLVQSDEYIRDLAKKSVDSFMVHMDSATTEVGGASQSTEAPVKAPNASGQPSLRWGYFAVPVVIGAAAVCWLAFSRKKRRNH